MTTLADVTALRESGCFSQALKTLDEVGVKNGERPTASTLKAELLERTGAYTQSRSITEGLLAGKQISVADRSTCELVLGRLELEIGAVDSGIAHLQRSATFASQGAELARLCWAQLRLLLVLSDRSGPDSVVPLLGELRVNVMRSGDPSIMAALHIYLAETEAKRGLLRNAQRHLGIGKRSLSGFSNCWLEALAENVESAIETMRSDFGTALTHARRCLELAEQSGALSIHESALGNLGNLSLLASRHEEAIDCLTRAQAARKGSDNWIACVDTSARIHLAKNELVGVSAAARRDRSLGNVTQ